MDRLTELIAVVQEAVDDSNRIVMEGAERALTRALVAGAWRASEKLDALVREGQIRLDEDVTLRRHFEAGKIPSKEVLLKIRVPAWIGRPGESAADVLASPEAVQAP